MIAIEIIQDEEQAETHTHECRGHSDNKEGCPVSHDCLGNGNNLGWCLEFKGHGGSHTCGRCGSTY